MPTNKCCPGCFQNKHLQTFIRTNGKAGHCDYCKVSRSKVIAAPELRELFKPVVELYEPAQPDLHYASEGIRDILDYETLGSNLDEDWGVFSKNLEPEVRDNLMEDIWRRNWGRYDDAYDDETSTGWARNDERLFTVSPEQTWRWFAEEVKRNGGPDIEFDDSGEIVSPERWVAFSVEAVRAVRIITPRTRLYRGRPEFIADSHAPGGKRPLPPVQMHAPPPEYAKASRVSRDGEPRFYAGFDIPTAVVESGRTPGVFVSVRRVAARRNLVMVDLTKFHGVVQPFGVEDLESVVRHSRLLQQLNIELSRPVQASDATIEYLPSQCLAEAIRIAGYDGICYKSSLRPGGHNIVVFDPSDMRVCSSRDHQACVLQVPQPVDQDALLNALQAALGDNVDPL